MELIDKIIKTERAARSYIAPGNSIHSATGPCLSAPGRRLSLWVDKVGCAIAFLANKPRILMSHAVRKKGNSIESLQQLVDATLQAYCIRSLLC
jgi:hypothetical protein